MAAREATLKPSDVSSYSVTYVGRNNKTGLAIMKYIHNITIFMFITIYSVNTCVDHNIVSEHVC